MQVTKRRLTDLWVVGKLIELDDGTMVKDEATGEMRPDPIKFWFQKLNQMDMIDTTRRCDAQRARVMAMRSDHESDAWYAITNAVRDFVENNGADKVTDFLLIEERPKVTRNHESRIANEDEWAKDNYLMGLRDAWIEGLERKWLLDKEDAEAARCMAELERFSAEVQEAVDNEMDALRDGFRGRTQVSLEEAMAERLLEMESNQAWMQEMWRNQIYLGLRDPDDRRQRYLRSRDEVDELSPKTFEFLRDAYQNLEVDVIEGKELQAATPSSPSPAQPSEAATEGASGLVGATP